MRTSRPRSLAKRQFRKNSSAPSNNRPRFSAPDEGERAALSGPLRWDDPACHVMFLPKKHPEAILTPWTASLMRIRKADVFHAPTRPRALAIPPRGAPRRAAISPIPFALLRDAPVRIAFYPSDLIMRYSAPSPCDSRTLRDKAFCCSRGKSSNFIAGAAGL